MRVQILPLPSVMRGDDMEEPFALVVDQCPLDMRDATLKNWQQFGQECGARTVLVTPATVEVLDR